MIGCFDYNKDPSAPLRYQIAQLIRCFQIESLEWLQNNFSVPVQISRLNFALSFQTLYKHRKSQKIV